MKLKKSVSCPEKVHPMFKDPQRVIQRVLVDGDLLVQAILFPDSKMALPVYNRDGSEQKILASINTILELLVEWHGPDKLVFANVVKDSYKKGNNPVFNKLIAGSHFNTRFAPTPSNQLHLGNARTALATYMLSLKDRTQSRFYLRIDNTDHQRSRMHLVEKIKDELRWLGLDWNEVSDTFQQGENYDTYKRILNILEIAEMTERDDEDVVLLKSIPLNQYYCVYYDWREGSRVTHAPPSTQAKNEAQIKLFRAGDGNAFYRYAGLVDDIRSLSGGNKLMYVLRDNRQRYLTQVQAHIRYALEVARQKLKSDSEVQHLFKEVSIDPQVSIPLPIYIHLPVVTDNGEVEGPQNDNSKSDSLKYTVLHKRRQNESYLLEKYTLNHLEQECKVLPESIVAYLVATILPPQAPNESWKDHLASIALIFSHLGVHSGLQFFSQSFTLDDLVRNQNPIHCDLRYIWFAEQVILKKLPFWRLKRKFNQVAEEFKKKGYIFDEGLADRIANNLAAFENWSQIFNTLKRPYAERTGLQRGSISPATKQMLRQANKEAKNHEEPQSKFTEMIRAEIDRRQEEIRRLTGSKKKERYDALSQLFRDLRYILTASESSAKINSLLSILGDSEAAFRIRRFLTERSV